MTTTAPNPTHQALRLAAQALFVSNPNPRVGDVLGSSEGASLAHGFTQQEGGLHANGIAVSVATTYVTLEPCTHCDLTLPCCDALIQARVGKVVHSIADPTPLVAGQGFARLRAASVEVEIGPGAEESREFNMGTSVK